VSGNQVARTGLAILNVRQLTPPKLSTAPSKSKISMAPPPVLPQRPTSEMVGDFTQSSNGICDRLILKSAYSPGRVSHDGVPHRPRKRHGGLEAQGPIRPDRHSHRDIERIVICMTFERARSCRRIEGSEEAESISSYVRGNDPSNLTTKPCDDTR